MISRLNPEKGGRGDMLRYGREIIRFRCGFCLLVLMAGGGSVQAAGEAPVIRVGCYDLKSFVRQTASG